MMPEPRGIVFDLDGTLIDSAGDIAAAEKHARLSSALSERITVAQAYNLDKKQMVLSILEDIRGV